MKRLAKKSLKWMLGIFISLGFIISNLLFLSYKEKAQSDFAKETLSFLLLEEDEADFKDTLEKLNKSLKGYSIVYLNKDMSPISNKDRIDLSDLSEQVFTYDEISKQRVRQSFLSYRKFYGTGDETIILLTTNNNIGYYIDYRLSALYLILLLYSLKKADEVTEDEVDLYLSGLSLDNIYKNISSPDYIELRPFLMAYINRVNQLKNDNVILAERVSEFTNMTANMKEGFIIFDGDGDIELINESAKKYLSLSKNANINNLIDSKEYTLALREAAILKRSKSLDIEINGYYLRIFIDPISNTSKNSFAMIVIDNSEDKKSEIMRREFTANVTHELKSPLTSINGYAELISTGIAKEDDVKKFAEIIHIEGNRLLEIIDDILKLSRLDENDFDKDFVEIDIYEVISFTIEKYKNLTDRKNIKVINDTNHYRIKTSKSLFYDLISNIYENAIKYNKLGGEIKVSADYRSNSFDLYISDTGIGIGQKDIDRIFERFYVADKSRKRNQKSTGLGLSIAKHIASYLGYDINVKSKLNEGTTFIIEIPIKMDN